MGVQILLILMSLDFVAWKPLVLEILDIYWI